MLKPVPVAVVAGQPEPALIRFDTLPDIVRKLRRIMDTLGAGHFAVCLVTPRGERRRLVPSLDANYPGIGEETKLLTTMLGDRFARRIAASTVPLWWAGAENLLHAPLVEQTGFTERINAPAGSPTGLALPVAIEHGPEGVVFFTGDGIAVTLDGLCDIHARCVGLFGVIAKLRPAHGNTVPSVSKRELECLVLTASGLTSEEIAGRLGLSVHTANQYLTNTTRKLNAVNRMQAVAKALRMGLFE